MTDAAATARWVDVFELARQRARVAGAVSVARMTRLAPSLAATGGTIEFIFDGFTDERGRPAAQLAFHGQVQLTCDRCGAPVPQSLEAAARYYFVRTEAELERIPVDESDEEPLLGSARFDLHELLEDEAILALPMSPRHPHCAPAKSSHAGEVGTDPERPHPFAALAQLKSRRQ